MDFDGDPSFDDAVSEFDMEFIFDIGVDILEFILDEGSGLGCDVDLFIDLEYCGVCGYSCFGISCTNGFCELTMLVEGFVDLKGIVVFGDFVYWVDSDEGMVFCVFKMGGVI